MATSLLPSVIDALVSLSDTALSTVNVYDGIGISDDPGDYLMVGVEDPDIEGAAFSADVEQARIAMAGVRQEAGTVTCCALSWNGDANQKSARDAAFATVAAVENILRAEATKTLGVSGVLKTEFGDRLTVSQAQDTTGASCMVIFSVAYLAQL